MNPAFKLLAPLSFVLIAPSHALDQLPLDQLQHGLWKVERKIEKLEENPVVRETRHSEYCASPKKEILKTLRTASYLCKTDVTKLADNKFAIDAACKLGIVSGTNKTTITIVSPSEYSAEVENKGSKLGEKQHRKEFITAVRTGDCSEGESKK
ncbi:MAG: DUF3617 family protein [Betaproteobacteria bacterium]|nr:MAG: DUF3617 family protein [Betaproteobacteria bacterium]